MEKASSTNTHLLKIGGKNVNTSLGNGNEKGKAEIFTKNKCKRKDNVQFEKYDRKSFANFKWSARGHFGERKSLSREPDIWNKVMKNAEYNGFDGNSKKHNLNHLLNFSFAPRENHFSSVNHNNNTRVCWKYQKYTKEQYLHANCQFVVKEDFDYTKHILDPDLSVNWNAVEEIRFNFLKNETTICPICLYEPVAAKITKCGHIYCWPCILHYLSLSKNKWRKCPICFYDICQEDLRSVSSISKVDFKVGDIICLSLMKRKKGSVIINFITSDTLQTFFHFEKNLNESSFNKLLLATSEQILEKVVNRELEQLSQLYEKEKETPEVCFIEKALKHLDERRNHLISIKSLKELKQVNAKSQCTVDFISKNNTSVDELEKIVDETLTLETQKVSKQNCTFSKSLDEKNKILLKKIVESHTIKVEEQDKDDKGDYYFFYQSSDGQHIYLNSLNIKMLCEQYGSLEKCPSQVEGKILNINWSFMEKHLRKRFRYLEHLPLNCEFRDVEIEILKPKINDKVMEKFKKETDKRQKIRDQRALEEKKRDNNIKMKCNKKWHEINNLPALELSSNHFPLYFSENCLSSFSTRPEFLSLSEEEMQQKLQNVKEKVSNESSTDVNKNDFVSFATMLKSGTAKSKTGSSAAASDLTREIFDENMCSFPKPLCKYSLRDAFEEAMIKKSLKKKNKKKRRAKANFENIQNQSEVDV